ncbi:hypothetical protein I3843_01G209300 [Carya illinoinensis]|uniref:Uncharacterized protein n=1 Tax=Carya illinoinensis TaxID=32201 RepID=A0A8T1RQA6_CARIL|nr:uncharacterized protein LOC122303232 [Carya illinoinensis]KAG2728639.1 hypothetical protein I3760_01G214400 [Carya illinoinensis]KAG6669074.1 hypothetical protein CIPAW_01G217500 [Carya illinoinensis]KAG7997392.1 hypothetical protein I3843_01G209300 [Carya illinoinensis]
MALDHETHHPYPAQANLTPAVRYSARRQIPLRRRKLPIVRLGDGKKPRRVLTLVKIFRRIRLRWLKLKYIRMMRKFKKYYRNVVKDLMEAGATLETFHQRVIMEASLAVPVMGVSFNSYRPSVPGSHRPRTLVM